jgi:hypothetical protein
MWEAAFSRGHVRPQGVARTDRLQRDEHPGSVTVAEPVAVGVELLEPVLTRP